MHKVLQVKHLFQKKKVESCENHMISDLEVVRVIVKTVSLSLKASFIHIKFNMVSNLTRVHWDLLLVVLSLFLNVHFSLQYFVGVTRIYLRIILSCSQRTELKE